MIEVTSGVIIISSLCCIFAIPLLILVSFLHRLTSWHSTRYKYAHVPQPKRTIDLLLGFHPVLGQQILQAFSSKKQVDPMLQPDGTYINAVYGGMSIDGKHCITFTTPEAFKTVLINTDIFRKSVITYSLLREALGVAVGTTLDDKRWKVERRALTPMFHFQQLKYSVPIMVANAKRFVQELETKSNDGILLLHENQEFKSVALRIGIDAIFGGELIHHTELYNLFLDYARAFSIYITTNLMGPWVRWVGVPSWLFGCRSVFSIRASMEKFVSGHLDKKRTQFLTTPERLENENNLISRLLRTETNVKFTDQEILNQVINFLFGATDTTSTLLAWTVQHLGQDSEIQRKVHAEIDEYFAMEHRKCTTLKYTQAVLQEVQRLHPALPVIEREAIEDCVVDGVNVPAGTNVVICPYASHMDTRHWDAPKEFRPERFLMDNKRRHPFAFIPFSAGPRTCIARAFAFQEATLVLAHLLRKYKVELRKPGVPTIEMVLLPKGMICALNPRE